MRSGAAAALGCGDDRYVLGFISCDSEDGNLSRTSRYFPTRKRESHLLVKNTSLS